MWTHNAKRKTVSLVSNQQKKSLHKFFCLSSLGGLNNISILQRYTRGHVHECVLVIRQGDFPSFRSFLASISTRESIIREAPTSPTLWRILRLRGFFDEGWKKMAKKFANGHFLDQEKSTATGWMESRFVRIWFSYFCDENLSRGRGEVNSNGVNWEDVM